ncbi:hypothetical protein [Mesorhizobium humile]|uniref:Uncharacterized protein n=1 Tax=Mesorhizobium humile TaxID=3072313 RepID=A0ABU4YDS9_9HYPH|nr:MULTISPECIES: hypothetical protein [unclassified Mesorhizobium]MDX8460838.1 hypothetical protein [Mesorhizobium sp. VK2D]MDX8485073.1 hypothetical protein [Mesorhizobium sp. VK2B]
MAEQFGVEPWSKEFYQIIFCIIERADYLIALIDEIELDEDIRNEAKTHVNQAKLAFSKASLSNRWTKDGPGLSRLKRENIQPIKMLSPQVRQKISFPKLNGEELSELVAMLDELEGWLQEHQLKEQDFIRQALIDGTRQVRFRLERVGWLGWGYTVESLRDVIGAYLALERGFPDLTTAPDAEAVLKKTGAFIKKFYEKTALIKDVSDTADFLLRAYGATTLLLKGAGIAGLLTFGG